MELAEKLREIMKNEFGITTDEELLEACEKIDDSIFSVFTTPLRRDYERAA